VVFSDFQFLSLSLSLSLYIYIYIYIYIYRHASTYNSIYCILFSVFNNLLDDTPLPANEESSSVLAVTHLNASLQNGKGAIGGGKPATNGEVEKGLVTLISSDSPGLQVSFYYLMMTLILNNCGFLSCWSGK
jgi:hypothetical protein